MERRKAFYSFGDLAKECNKRGLKIKGPTIMDYLVQRGFLQRREGMPFTLPTDISYEQGLMQCEKLKINNYTHVHAVLTPEGLEYFADRLVKHYKVPQKLV